MPEGKSKFIEDAALVIDGRVAALKEELARNQAQDPNFPLGASGASDRAAILEAEHLARMIRSLAGRPYRGDPYKVACKRWAKGEAG